MAKNTYIGIDGVARKVKGCYIGINGVARKITKGYIGINGVAHQFYSASEIYTIRVYSADTTKGTVSGFYVFEYSPSASSQTVSLTTTFTPVSGYELNTLTPSIGSISGTTLTIPANTRGNITVAASWKAALSPVLGNNSWADIKQAAIDGVASSLWSIGAYKDDTVTGRIGLLDRTGTYRFFIAGFNHNATVEGNKTILFMVKNSTYDWDIAFLCGKSGDISTANYYNMNISNSNAGGWKSSQMRANICGGATDVTNGSYTFLSTLSSGLKAAIARTKIYSDNTGGGVDDASYVTATYDKIYLPSEFELKGVRAKANSAEQNYQKQFQYYINGNSTNKRSHDATSTYNTTNYVSYYTRSVYYANKSQFARHITDTMSVSRASQVSGFAPCFKVGADTLL